MTARIEAGDLLHAVTTPPEIYFGEGGLTTIVNNTRVQNRRETSLEVINNLVNRIALIPQVQMTYQDRIYITNVLNRLGIQNVTQFMNQVFRLKQETQTTEQLISLYWNHLEDLTRIVQEYQAETAYTEAIEENIQEQFRLHLHEEIMKRLQTGAIYQILNNFQGSRAGASQYITGEELQITEQKRLAANILLNQLKNIVGGGDVPFTYRHENYYENHMPEESQITDASVNNQITSAVLLNLVDNLYLNYFEKMSYETPFWLHLEHSFYQSAENTLWRLKNEMNHWFTHTTNREYRNMKQEQAYHQELQAVLQLLAWNQEETELPGLFYETAYEEEQMNLSHYDKTDIRYSYHEKAEEEAGFSPETGSREVIAEKQTQMEHRIWQNFEAAGIPKKVQEALMGGEKRQNIRGWPLEGETLPAWNIYRMEHQAGSSVYSEEYFQSLVRQPLDAEKQFSQEIRLKEVVRENRISLERRIRQYLENFQMERQGEETGTQGWPIPASWQPFEDASRFLPELWRADGSTGAKAREKTEAGLTQNLEYHISEEQEESASYTTNADYRQWLQGRQDHFYENVEQHVSDSHPVHHSETAPSGKPYSREEPERQETAQLQADHQEQPAVRRQPFRNLETEEQPGIAWERVSDNGKQTSLSYFEEADIRYPHPEKVVEETALLPEMSPREVSVETQTALEQRIQQYFETVGEPWKTPKVMTGEVEKRQDTGRWKQDAETLSAWTLSRTQDQMGGAVHSEEYLQYLKLQELEKEFWFQGEAPLREVVQENRMNLERQFHQYLENVRIEQQRQRGAVEPQGWPEPSDRQQAGTEERIFLEPEKAAGAAGMAAKEKTETYFAQNLEYRVFGEPEESLSYTTNADYRQWLAKRQERFYENVEQYVRYLHYTPQAQAASYELIYHTDDPENREPDSKEPAAQAEAVKAESGESEAVPERWRDRKTEERVSSLSRFEKLENQAFRQVERRNQILAQDYETTLEPLQEIHQKNQNIDIDFQNDDKHTWLIHQEERQDTGRQLPEDEALSAWPLYQTQVFMGGSVYSEEYLRYLKLQELEKKFWFSGEAQLREVVQENRLNLERQFRQYLENVRIEQQRQRGDVKPQGWPGGSVRTQPGTEEGVFPEPQKEAGAFGTAAKENAETYFAQNLEYRVFGEPEESLSYTTNADYRQWLTKKQEHFHKNTEQFDRYLHYTLQPQTAPYELIHHTDDPENRGPDSKEPPNPAETVKEESRGSKAVQEWRHDQKTEERVSSLSRFEKLENQAFRQVERRNQILTQDYDTRLEQLQEIRQENQNIDMGLQEGDKHTWLIHQEERQDTLNQEENLELLEQKLKQVREQNYKNLTQYQQYVQQYSVQEKRPKMPAAQRIQRESLKALKEPEEFLKEYRESAEEEQKQEEVLRQKIMQALPKETRRIYERIEQYQKNPAPTPDGERITKNNMGLLLHDLQQAAQETETETKTSVENREQILELSESVLEKWGEKRAVEKENPGRTEYGRNDVSLIHKTTENYIDEELLEQLLEQNRLNRTATKVIGQTDEERSEIHKTILGQTSKTVVQENQDITELIQNGVRRQLGIISDQVYSKLEKRLQNEKKRRGY